MLAVSWASDKTQQRKPFIWPLLALGLPAPAAWQRLRLALQVPLDSVARLGEFPPARQALDAAHRQRDYQARWSGLRKRFVAPHE